jgi:NTE family protein
MSPADVIATPRWPVLPYKGLTYYTGADAVLFAGRDDDIVRCSAILAEWKMRLLLLHGATGCGKSSFLRAGLIPYLEATSAGIAFARTEAVDQAPLMFVRSTSDPLRSLADSVYAFAAREITRMAPDGHFTIRLRDALPAEGAADAAGFRQLCGEDPEILLGVLEHLSAIVPETLVLIIDQGEEVLTVDPGPDGEQSRRRFFEFVADFARASFDLKLLIALRTEYFGRFVSRVRRNFRGPGIGEYYLDTLTNDQVTEAIERPTSTKPIASLGAPRDHYRFTFDEGLIGRIISELPSPGTNLPAVQIVCTSLYEIVRNRPEPWIITLDDLTTLGGVEGSIGRFIDQQIRSYGDDMRLSPGESDQEITLWKNAMVGLTRAQPDGTVTTDLKPESMLREEVATSRFNFDAARDRFASDDIRLLRKVDVVKAGTGTLIPCVGLGHDVLGLVLQKWKLGADQQREGPSIQLSEPVELDDERIPHGVALCLSGGGYRAMLFHLGALWKLNEIGYLPKLDLVSAVSAGAILGALLGLRWTQLTFDDHGVAPAFVETVVTPIRMLATHTVDVGAVMSGLLLLQGNGASQLAVRLSELLYGDATLQDWPDRPRVIVSATNLQCGSLFRFSKRHLADYRLGRVPFPTLSVATAVAASAAVPPVLSPMILKFRENEWSEMEGSDVEPWFRTTVHLTDGSIYDNLALETAWLNYRTILISDGGPRQHDDPTPSDNWAAQTGRILDLIQNNVRSLRRRQVIEAFVARQRNGVYWSIGSHIGNYASRGIPEDATWMNGLDALPARYRLIDGETQERLINWGYAVCDAAMRTHMEATGETKLPYRVVLDPESR